HFQRGAAMAGPMVAAAIVAAAAVASVAATAVTRFIVFPPLEMSLRDERFNRWSRASRLPRLAYRCLMILRAFPVVFLVSLLSRWQVQGRRYDDIIQIMSSLVVECSAARDKPQHVPFRAAEYLVHGEARLGHLADRGDVEAPSGPAGVHVDRVARAQPVEVVEHRGADVGVDVPDDDR